MEISEKGKCFKFILVSFFIIALQFTVVLACTGIQLIGEDGTVARGRTNEWGAFPMYSIASVVPIRTHFQGTTPDGTNGIIWESKYGFVTVGANGGITMDGMNTEGLSAGGFFHSGFAKYEEYVPTLADKSLCSKDVINYLLSNFSTTQEAKEGLKDIRVVSVLDPLLGSDWPAHCMITDKSGDCIVVEFTDGEIVFYDNPVGVITNNPNFDWQLTNLRNYGFISYYEYENVEWGDLEISPLAVGSGMLGLPGDFTSPSRFVRAVAFSQYSRETKGGFDTVKEIFRILDNFNVGINIKTSSDLEAAEQMPSSTQWTLVNDTKNLIMYYHTMYNRRVREINLNDIDFSKGEVRSIPLDKTEEEDIENVTGSLK